MATLVLTVAGTIVGGPIGGAIGAMAGSAIDAELFRAPTRRGPPLGDLTVQVSSYRQPIPQVFGTCRIAGCVIWAAPLRETTSRQSHGKGAPRTETYSYSASFAVALSARQVTRIGRIWADGKLLRGSAGDFKTACGGFRLNTGDPDQPADPLIAAHEGVTPAYRGTAYAVFEDLALGDYGNRIPSLSFEVVGDDNAIAPGAVLRAVADGGLAGVAARSGADRDRGERRRARAARDDRGDDPDQLARRWRRAAPRRRRGRHARWRRARRGRGGGSPRRRQHRERHRARLLRPGARLPARHAARRARRRGGRSAARLARDDDRRHCQGAGRGAAGAGVARPALAERDAAMGGADSDGGDAGPADRGGGCRSGGDLASRGGARRGDARDADAAPRAAGGARGRGRKRARARPARPRSRRDDDRAHRLAAARRDPGRFAASRGGRQRGQRRVASRRADRERRRCQLGRCRRHRAARDAGHAADALRRSRRWHPSTCASRALARTGA